MALQIAGAFTEIGKHTLVKTVCVMGGVSQDPQISQLNNGVDIVVATPGRMFDLASQGHLGLYSVEILVLDEADHMLALGFLKDIQDLMRKLPRKRQTLFFSATINETIKDLAYSIVVNPIRIQISPKDPVNKNINHSVAFIEMDDKRFFLERIVTENPEKKILVFVRTKVRAERVQKSMERVKIVSNTIHGDKDQAERQLAMSQFRSGEVKLLIATDVSARGIDIPDVDFVVNYDLPEEPENYVHRVGRTGRGVRKGNAVTFCSTEEKVTLEKIEEYLGKSINVLEIEKRDYHATLDFSEETLNNNWKQLLRDANKAEQKKAERPIKPKKSKKKR